MGFNEIAAKAVRAVGRKSGKKLLKKMVEHLHKKGILAHINIHLIFLHQYAHL